jgi:large subunit ribosomal protein L4
MALSSQFKAGNIIIVDSINVSEAKTKKAVELMNCFGVNKKKVVFVIYKNIDKNFKLAIRNIKNVMLKNVENMNTYDVLWADKLIISCDVINEINKRWIV